VCSAAGWDDYGNKKNTENSIATEEIARGDQNRRHNLKSRFEVNGERDRNADFQRLFRRIRVDYEDLITPELYEKFSTGLGRIIHSSQTQIFERKSKADAAAHHRFY
jgi:hypothetical protein